MRLLPLLLLLSACTGPTAASATTSSAPSTSSSARIQVVDGPRTIEADLEVIDGVSEPLVFTVPEGTRSVGVTAEGRIGDVIGVVELTLADGDDRVGVRRIPPPLLEGIGEQHVRLLPGDVFQEAGLGLHAFVYPNTPAPAQLPAGEAVIRFASTGRSLDISVVLPPVSEELILPVDLFTTASSAPLKAGSAVLLRAEELLGQAGIDLRWETVAIIDVEEPPIRVEDAVAPDGPVADLVAAAAPEGTDALDIFVLEEMPVSGLSPRIPGPAIQSPLRAVLVEAVPRPSDLGRVIAHELAHYLGLQHPELHSDDGRIIEDPIPDTEGGSNNLMAGGTILTPGQVDVLRRSPLLEPSG